MKVVFLTAALQFLFCCPVYAWGWKELGEEASAPITTSARKVVIVGSVATLSVIVFEHLLIDPVQEKAVKDEPLGKWSVLGDWAGQVIPNGLYIFGQSIAGANGNKKGYERALGMFKATAYSISVTTVLKYTIQEPRPNNSGENNSFPSGHTTTAFAFSGYVLEEHGWRWGIPAIGLSLLSGLSRINDNRHDIDDILAGATIGFAYGIGISKYEKKNEKLSFLLVPIFDYQNKGIAVVKEF